MNNFFKNATVWIVIGIVMLTVFNSFSPNSIRQQTIDYSTFLELVRTGKYDDLLTTVNGNDVPMNSVTSAMLASTAATTLSAGAGITGGTGTIYKSEVVKLGDIIHTNIIIDLTGLNSSAAGDIIGKQGTANCHLGQITAAVNGTILFGEIK